MPRRHLSGPLAQVVQVAAELVDAEADPEQAPDLVRRKGTRSAALPHPVEWGWPSCIKLVLIGISTITGTHKDA